MKGIGVLSAAFALLLVGCGGSSSGDGGVTFARPAVQVSGLTAGQSVSVSLDGGQVIVFNTNGRQTFNDRLANGDRYNLAITATSGGADCRFSNGQTTISRTTVTQDTPVICGEPGDGPGDPTDPTDPTDPGTPSDPDGGTGELRIISAAGQEGSLVTMALRIVRPGGVYTGPLELSDLQVLREGIDVASTEEQHLHLENNPERQRVIIAHVDASISMRDHLAGITTALLDLYGHTEPDYDHRLYLAVFDAGPETRYIYPAGSDLTESGFAGMLDYWLPPGGAFKPGTNLNTALFNAAASSGDSASAVHFQTIDSVVITDGRHLSGSLQVEAIRSAMQGRRVSIIAYGPDADIPALQLIDPDVRHVTSAAALSSVLVDIANEQTSRTAGVRLLHHLAPEDAREPEVPENYTLTLSGGLCTTGDCTASRLIGGASGGNRGTYTATSNPAPFVHETTKLKALRWVDNWLGRLCPGTGEYQWAVRTGEFEFVPIDQRAEFVIFDANGTVIHDGGGADPHHILFTNDSEYLFVNPGAEGSIELYAAEDGQFLNAGCRSSIQLSVQRAPPFEG